MSSKPYHHGNLRRSLLTEASKIIQQNGIEALSLRKLGDALGVSRTAPYHHFANKNALLCALAEEGFIELTALMQSLQHQTIDSIEASLKQLVDGYVDFALQNPARYELMFGRAIWKTIEPTSSLKETAHNSFRCYTELMQQLLQHNGKRVRQPLPFAQASWAMLHGLCRFMLDGIYGTSKNMEQISAEATAMLFHHLQSSLES